MELFVKGFLVIANLIVIAVLCAAIAHTLTRPPLTPRTYEEHRFYADINRWLNYHGELEEGTPSAELAPKASAALGILVTADDIDQVRQDTKQGLREAQW